MAQGLAAGPDRFDGNQGIIACLPSDWLAAREGQTATILKGPVQLRESFSLRTL